MPRIRQHVPKFFDEGKVEDVEFNTLEELEIIPFVKGFIDSDWGIFRGFALEDNALMAVYDNGDRWWVVGFIDDTSTIDLPKWKKGEKPR